MNIKCLVLNNGQEIIAQVEETDVKEPDLYTIKEPISILLVPSQSGQVSIQFIPYLPYSENRVFKIRRCHVFSIFKPNTEISNKYSQMYGSGITVATAQDLNILKG